MGTVYLLEPSLKIGDVRDPSYDGHVEDYEEAYKFFRMQQSKWRPPEPWTNLAEIERQMPRAFRLHFGLVVSAEVWDLLSEVLDTYVETFPVGVNSIPHIALRGKTLYDSRLIEDQSEVRRFKDSGRIMRIKRYVFDTDGIDDVFHDSSGGFRLFVTGSTSEHVRDVLTKSGIEDLRMSDVSVRPPKGRPAW